MRVCLVTTSFPIDKNRTSGLFIEQLAKELSKHIDLSVLTPATNKHINYSSDANFKLIRFSYAPKNFQILAQSPGGIPEALRSNPFCLILLPIFVLSLFIKSLRLSRHVDIFHANWSITGIVVGVAAKLVKKPCVTTLRGSDVNIFKKSRLGRIILLVTVKLATSVTTVSSSIKSDIQRVLPNYKNPVLVIPNGINNIFFSEKKLLCNHETVKITCIGNLTKNKDIATIIYALHNLLPRFKISLTVIGDGPERANLLEIVNHLNLENYVSFLGQTSQAEIVTILSQTDIFVHASLSEGRSNVILEAMAASLPIVASDIEANKELILHLNNGLIYEQKNPKDLAEKITLLLVNTKLRSQLSENSYHYVRENKLTWAQSAQNYLDLYKTLFE